MTWYPSGSDWKMKLIGQIINPQQETIQHLSPAFFFTIFSPSVWAVNPRCIAVSCTTCRSWLRVVEVEKRSVMDRVFQIQLWTYTRWAPSPVLRRVVSCNSTYKGWNHPSYEFIFHPLNRIFIRALKLFLGPTLKKNTSAKVRLVVRLGLGLGVQIPPIQILRNHNDFHRFLHGYWTFSF